MSDIVDNRLTTEQGDVVVVQASSCDAMAILRPRDALAGWVVERGIDQWHPGDLPLSWIELCVAQGWVFAARRDDALIGSLKLVWEDPFVWGSRNEAAGYIHMVRSIAHSHAWGSDDHCLTGLNGGSQEQGIIMHDSTASARTLLCASSTRMPGTSSSEIATSPRGFPLWCFTRRRSHRQRQRGL